MVLSSDRPHERTLRCSLSAETKIELALMTILGALENVSLAWHTGCAKKKTAAQTGGIRNKVISFLQSQGRERNHTHASTSQISRSRTTRMGSCFSRRGRSSP
jgi:hypothetical protein